MSVTEKSQYIEPLKGHVVDVMSEVSGPGEGRDGLDDFCYFPLELEIFSRVTEQDWGEFGFNSNLATRGQACKLIQAAFLDSVQLVSLAEGYLTRQNYSESYGEILRRSGRNLLEVARLDENKVRNLLASINSGGLLADLGPDFPSFSGECFVLTQGQDGECLLDWCPEIKEWIETHKTPGRGCPAHEEAVVYDGQNISLIRFFWNQLMKAIYKESTSSPS